MYPDEQLAFQHWQGGLRQTGLTPAQVPATTQQQQADQCQPAERLAGGQVIVEQQAPAECQQAQARQAE